MMTITQESHTELQNLIEYARLAPSSHNTQPWTFHINGTSIELLADKSRALPVADPEHRELIISCGAALTYLHIAAHHYGYQGQVELLPDSNRDDLLARFSLAGPYYSRSNDERLFSAMEHRHTQRGPFQPLTIPDATLQELTQAADSDEVEAIIFTADAEKQMLADLVAEGDEMQAANSDFRSELASWLRPNHTRSHDGMPGYAFGLNEMSSLVTPLMIRYMNWGKLQARRDRKALIVSPALLLLTSKSDEKRSWLATGQALSRVLLAADAAGLGASFLNQPIQVASLRRRLREQLKREDYPQILLRLGYGSAVRATPRRSLSEVLV